MRLDEAAKKYLGVKFHHQGRSTAGMDCLGLVVLSAKDIGIDLEDYTTYGRSPDAQKLKEEANRQFTKINIDEVESGDILLMKFVRYPQHLAIKTDKGIIHAYESVGKVVEHGYDKSWVKRTVGAYRIG